MALTNTGHTSNYTIGKGKLYAQFAGATNYLYLGNAPSFSLTISPETVEHMASTGGVKQVDKSAVIGITRTAALTLDDIQPENVARFFLGSNASLTTAAAAGQSETITASPGDALKLGVSAANPSGAQAVDTVVVEDAGGGGTTYVLGTDYEVDLDRAMVYIIIGGGIAASTDLDVTYGISASTNTLTVSGNDQVNAALRYVENNPVGSSNEVFLPDCLVTPDGEYSFIGDDFRTFGFSVTVNKPTTSEAIYINSQPLRS